MLSKLRENNEFELSTFIIIILTVGISAFNYIYQLVIGNILAPDEFGYINVLLSFIVILGIPTNVLALVTVKLTAQQSAIWNSLQFKNNIIKILKYNCVINSLELVILIYFSKYFMQSLNIYEIKQYYLLILIIILNSYLLILWSILQGFRKYVNYSIAQYITIIFKLILGVILIMMNFKIIGLLIAIITGTLVSLLYSVIYNYKFIKEIKECRKDDNQVVDNKLNIISIKHILKNIAITQIIILLILNGDLILLQLLKFDSGDIGYYTACMSITKISMYITVAITTTLVPTVTFKNEIGENTMCILHKSILYSIIISIIVFIPIFFFGENIIILMYGINYYNAINYLIPCWFLVLQINVIILILNYCIAINKQKSIYITFPIIAGLLLYTVATNNINLLELIYFISFIFIILIIINYVYILIKNKGEYNVER